MDDSEKILSDIFHQKLDEVAIDFNAPKSFVALQIKMSLQKFFHLNLRHFNIYYASAIFCCVFFNGVLGVQYFKNQKEIIAMKVELNNQQIAFEQLLQSKLQTSLPATIKDSEALPKKVFLAQIDSLSTNKNAATKKELLEKPSKSVLSTADSVNLNVIETVINNNLKAPAKTLYIVKQDTIIQYDSIPLLPRKTRSRKK